MSYAKRFVQVGLRPEVQSFFALMMNVQVIQHALISALKR